MFVKNAVRGGRMAEGMSVRRMFASPKAKIAVGIIFYVGLLLSYVAPILPNCSERFMGAPGDQTAFAWLSNATPDSPLLWGNTTWTNAPYGENLYQPMHITGLIPYTATWAMTKVVTPECAFNILMSFGFILTSVVTFLFILWLTRRKSYVAAWFGGYAATFTPYIMAKTPYHVSYVYCGLLVGLLWLLLVLWKKRSYRVAAGLMVLTAAIFYHDPYFIELSIVLYLSFFVGLALYVWRAKIPWKHYGDFIKKLLFVSPIFLVLITPMVYTRVAYSNQIDQAVKNSRDSDIMQEGLVYGARPWEYFFPSTYNPLLPDKLKQFKYDHQHGSNPAETTLYVGLVPTGLTLWFLVMYFRKKLEKDAISSRVDLGLIVSVTASLVVIAGLLSLLPRASIFGLEFHFPSELLLSLTSMWRVPARLIVIVQIGLAIFSALALTVIISRLSGRKVLRFVVIGGLIVASFLEFLSYNPFDRWYWGYDKIPSTYAEVKDNPSVKRIAEYPMLDPPRNYAFIYYLTYQSYHRKQMINSAKVNSPMKSYRESIADVDDWQTPGVLKQLGVDRVLVHSSGASSTKSPYLDAITSSSDPIAGDTVTSYALSSGVAAKPYLLRIGAGFDGPSSFGYQDIDYYMHGTGLLVPTLLPSATSSKKVAARIEYYGFNKQPMGVTFSQNGKILATRSLTKDKQIAELLIDTDTPVKIDVTHVVGDNTLVVSNMEIK